jgi:hypothetical protein
MDKKQKEALVIAMLEKGESYRDISRKCKVSPNTIKAISNRAGLDETTSISSRAFELYAQQKTPVQVVIELNIEAKDAIRYHQEYFMLLGCTEFTKIYLQIKDNPWPYVNLTKLVQNARMGDTEIVELLKITNEYLPRVRLEYDRVKEELNSTKAELNSWKAELSNTVRIYQQFVDRNLSLKKREDELKESIRGLEIKMADKLTAELQKVDNSYSNIEVQQENGTPSMAIDSPQNENKMHTQAEPSSRIILDTRDFF